MESKTKSNKNAKVWRQFINVLSWKRRRPLGVTRPDRSHSRCCKTSDESEEPLSKKPEPLANGPDMEMGMENSELKVGVWNSLQWRVPVASSGCQWPYLLPVFREAMPKTRKTPLSIVSYERRCHSRWIFRCLAEFGR